MHIQADTHTGVCVYVHVCMYVCVCVYTSPLLLVIPDKYIQGAFLFM